MSAIARAAILMLLTPACGGRFIEIGRDPPAAAQDVGAGTPDSLTCGASDGTTLPGTFQVKAKLDDVPLLAKFELMALGSNDACFNAHFAGDDLDSCGLDGLLVLRGNVTGSGPFSPSATWLHLPASAQGRERWLCAGPATDFLSVPATFSDPAPWNIGFNMTNLRELSCPGRPIARSIRLEPSDLEVRGGDSLDSSYNGGSCGRPTVAIERLSSSCAVLNVFLATDPPHGFLLSSAQDPTPDTLYCIGSVVEQADGSLALSDFSVAGRCEDGRPVSDELNGCMFMP